MFYRESNISRTEYETFWAGHNLADPLQGISIDNQGKIYENRLSFDGYSLVPLATDAEVVSVRNSRYTVFRNLDITGKMNRIGIHGWGNIGGGYMSIYDNHIINVRTAIDTTDYVDVSIYDNDISQFSDKGIYVGGKGFVSVKGNIIHDFSADAGIGIGGWGLGGVGEVLIENNDIYNCGAAIGDTHTDLLQVYNTDTEISNVKIIGNKFHDTPAAFANICPGLGRNFVIQDNIFWNKYTSAPQINLWISGIKGLTLTGNTIIGGLVLDNCQDIVMNDNIIDLIDVRGNCSFLEIKGNVINRGTNLSGRYIPINYIGQSMDKWNSPEWTSLFVDFANCDFRLKAVQPEPVIQTMTWIDGKQYRVEEVK